jgi:hypothetical protein
MCSRPDGPEREPASGFAVMVEAESTTEPGGPVQDIACSAMLPVGNAIVQATWGLVIATSLLVVASAIPVVLTLRERWLARAEHAARIVPPLHLLASRISGLAEGICDPHYAYRDAEDDIGGQLKMLGRLLDDAPALGIRFVSELFVARHLLTLARMTCEDCWREARRAEGGLVTGKLLETVALAHAQLVAALESVREAERLIPSRKIDREDFWSRFTRLSTERVERAESRDTAP